MRQELSLNLMDTHAGGDVSRIVLGGIDPLPGKTVRQQMEYLRDDADGLRRLLLEEPYGIPEMSVDLIVPPSHPDASVGYIIMEVMGYAIYSGSNTICTATAVLESGLVPKEEGRQRFMMESPAGLVHIEADHLRRPAQLHRHPPRHHPCAVAGQRHLQRGLQRRVLRSGGRHRAGLSSDPG